MKPILFNTEMVRAILEGRKTVTRRLVKDKDIINFWDCEGDGTPIAFIEQSTGDCHPATHPCSYQPGDILYVRETWTKLVGSYIYKADQKPNMKNPGKWRPSIHMPKAAARIFLRMKNVRVERLHEIDTYGAYAEGIPCCNIDPLCVGTCDKCMQPESPLHKFERLWNRTIKPTDRALYGWEADPWVWVIEFERITREEAMKYA